MRHIHFIISPIKPHLLLVSILLMPFLIQVVIVQATPETVVKVEPYSSYANIGETFTINIAVADVQNLYGVEVNLYWNFSILKPVNIDVRLGEIDGVLYNPVYVVQNSTQDGKYVLAATSMAPAPSFNGTGNIVRITFTATNPGNCKFDLETELWDYPPPNQGSMPIEHTTIDGFFDVIPEFPNILILPLFIILTIFVVVFCKKISRKLGSRLFDSQLSKQNLLV